jgi:hypothetical protein
MSAEHNAKAPSAHFHYKVCWPAHDAVGGDLTKIEGAWVELLHPGECEYRRVKWLTYPDQVAQIDVFADGQYDIRHVVVGACTESKPSPSVPVSIDLMPPGTPPAGSVMIPCCRN